jgi:hypothetical protein
MKKMILTGTVILALAGASLQSARAGDREWATVGKVLTGVAVAGLVVAAVDGHAQCRVDYSCGAPADCPPPAPACHYAYYNYCPAPERPAAYCAPAPVAFCPAQVVVYPAHRHFRYEGWHNRW